VASPDFERRFEEADRSAEELARLADADVEKAEQDAQTVLARHPRAARLATLARAVLREQSAQQVGLAAAGAAFWLVISAFPTGIAVVSLFGLVVSPDQVAHDLGSLARDAPSSLGSLITEQLRRVAAADRTGVTTELVVSLVLAVWSASAGMYNLDRAIRYSFGLPPQRYVEIRARALAGAFAAVVVLGSLALGGALVGGRLPAVAIALVGVPLVLVALTLGVVALYRFALGPTVRPRELLPGAAFAAVATVVSLAAFSAYLALSTRYTAVYGAFAGVVIGMIGVYLAVYAVLLGAVLNAQLKGTRESSLSRTQAIGRPSK
jgi:membrane protein